MISTVVFAFDVLVSICSLNDSLLSIITPMSFSDDVSSRRASLKVLLSSRIYKWNLSLYSGGLSLEIRLCTYQDESGVAISRTICIKHPGPPAEAVVHWVCLFVGTLFVSSAYITALESFLSASGRSLIYMTKSICPPWGIPLVTADHSEVADPTRILCFRPVRKLDIHFSRAPSIPYDSSFFSNLTWGTLSKAFMKSMYTASIVPPLSMISVYSSNTYRSAGLSIVCQWIYIGVD